jgi:hypothetical protein
MSSGGLTYEQTPAAHAEGLPAYGEAPSVADTAEGAPEGIARDMNWPLAFAIFTPVIAAYGAIAYSIYLAADAAF